MYQKYQFFVSCGVLVAVWGNFGVNYRSYKEHLKFAGGNNNNNKNK